MPTTRSLSPAILVALLLLLACTTTRAQEAPREEHVPTPAAPAAGMGRLYVFRGIRPFGAHIADFVTLNGTPVQRVSPGDGFYCDLKPGSYTIGMYRHKAASATLSIAAGRQQYVYVSVREQGGGSARGGAAAIDLAFNVRMLDPAYGAGRASEYRLFKSSCEPAATGQ